jgi:diguanylate cyclase (GGDEF)-like protein
MKVLIAEDDAVSRRLLQGFLQKWGYEVAVATQGDEAWKLLQSAGAPKLAILDWMMPGRDGVEICEELRRQTREPYTYVLLLTAKGQKQDLVAGLDAGADDYLSKPFDPQELRARLRAGCRIVQLQEQLVRAREALRAEATHDPLTGLWNRAVVLETLQRELSRSQRQGTIVAVTMADLDHFKEMNDTYGHLGGDAVLREVTRRMRSVTRTYDAFGRYGGEEFLIVAPDSNAAGALNQAERLRKCVDDEPIEIFEGPVHVTVSLGVAVSRGVSEADPLLRAADEALYRAKRGGRNRVELAVNLVEKRE